jgi:hypothetical protein
MSLRVCVLKRYRNSNEVCAFVGHTVTLLVQQRSDVTRILVVVRKN